ncbi:MAG: GNAT family N-acetyltransferase [Alphaproteobacteria bacterium]|nr:MAG: GNAT family N-acetyltransferase [Alphaproteobacteria bacterium]
MKTPTLQTERLVLRPISLDDAPAVQKYFNDWDIIKYMGVSVPWPYPEDGALTHIRDHILPQTESENWHVWAITLKNGNDEAIGMVNFRIIPTKDGNRGFWLAKPYHGRGIMTEAIYSINGFIFNVLEIDKFIVSNVKNNVASRRVKQKTGATFLREERALHHNGEDIAQIWEITKEDWLKHHIITMDKFGASDIA